MYYLRGPQGHIYMVIQVRLRMYSHMYRSGWMPPARLQSPSLPYEPSSAAIRRLKTIWAPPLLHVYLHREPQQVHLICSWYKKIYLMRVAHIGANGWGNRDRYGDEYRCGHGRQVWIYTGLQALRRSVNQEVLEASKVSTTITIWPERTLPIHWDYRIGSQAVDWRL